MLAEGKDVFALLPQKPPMVMVDKLLECTGQKAITGFKIEPGNLLVKNDLFSESGLIENMAQSAALMTGWLASMEQDGEQKNPIGVIGAVKDLQVFFLPLAGSDILTEIEVLYKVANATIVTGKVISGDRVAATCELKIFAAE
jgi:predicted hotdog family 3-hydroxylacyl-ACP dehydratase